MKSNLPVFVLLALTLGTTLFIAVNQGSPAPAGSDERLSVIEDRLEILEQLAVETRDEVRRAARATTARRSGGAAAMQPASEASAGRVAGATAGGAAEAALDSTELRQVVADSVQRTVEEQMERMAADKRYRGEDGRWKPPMDEVSKALELSESQQQTLATIFDSARDETFALLGAERDDGGSVLEDFVRDLRESEDQRQAFVRLFGAITTKSVPGRNQTYLEAFGEADGRIRERINASLDARQVERFQALAVDVFEVNTGYDPVGEYVKERLGDGAE